MKAYLDIETSFEGRITVVGIFRPSSGFVQLVGQTVNGENLLGCLERVVEIVTYNGSRFDLPVIKKELGVDLEMLLSPEDLMYACWELNLYGGLKVVEQTLGIKRETAGTSGRDAMVLWEKYSQYGDQQALERLLAYNREDVLNLPILEEKLGQMVLTEALDLEDMFN